MKKPRARPASSLAPIGLEAIDRFVRVLAACGATQAQLVQAVARACQRNRGHFSTLMPPTTPELTDAAHVLTLWSLDPLYLDQDGAPIPLPIEGPAPSFTALTRRVDRSLNPEAVLRYLLKTDAVCRVASRYALQSEAVSLRGSGAPARFRNLRTLASMLRTLEHNLRPKSEVPSWFEYIADNARFPVSARADFDASFDHAAMRLLQDFNAYMHRRASTRKRGEPTRRIGVGIYRFEDEPAEPAVPPIRSRRTRPQRR